MAQNEDADSCQEEGQAASGSMAETRRAIESIDRELLDVLNRRTLLSCEAGRLRREERSAIKEPLLEEELLGSLVAVNPGPLPNAHLRHIYREVLSSARHVERPHTIAYLGPEGTYSHVAGIEYLGNCGEFCPLPSLREVFAAVVGKEAELGVVPLENTLQGMVGQTVDLLLQFEAHIQAEVYCRINHTLLSRAQHLAEVTTVYSHPQALEQCAVWLSIHLPSVRVIPMVSTAAAAHRVLEEPQSAAIGHIRLGQSLGMNALAQEIEDQPDNWTRFLVIGSAEAKGTNRDKTSILFTLQDEAGSLATVLNLLARERINIKKLESRPLRGEKWKHVFFLDLECDASRPELRQVFTELGGNCERLRILGSYPSGPSLDVRRHT